MYWITARLGGIRGESWPIRETPLLMGRGRGCDVVVPDSLISRQHCVIALENGKVVLRDLGSSNLTLLNGRPITESYVNPGDEIAVGKTIFVVSRAVSPPELAADAEGEGDTVGPAADDSPHTPRYISTDVPVKGLSTIGDYVALFTLCRNISEAGTMAQLLEAVRKELEPRIPCRAVCFCRPVGEGEFSLFYQDGDATSSGIVPPRDLMLKAYARQHILQTRLPGTLASYVALAIPMSVGNERVGVLAICTPENVVRTDQNALHYLNAVSCQLAPYFHVIEQVEFLREENERLRSSGPSEPSPLVGESPAIARAHAQIQEAARSGMAVLIMGETGTGKELAARLLHTLSDRSEQRFVVVNCAAIPAELMESEFFGYEKGAFTGAHVRKIGRMEEAQGGTLFLDEIGDLSLENQARILRAIDTGTFYRVGGNKEIAVDVRVVAATNKNIPQLVQEGAFRVDLYHRINGFVIELPPLRGRIDDIPILADHFMRASQVGRTPSVRYIHPDAIEALTAWHWPGNVRELRNCIERACYLATGECIMPHDLRLPTVGGPANKRSDGASLADVERQHIIEVLEKAGGNVALAARLLGVSRPTVYRKMAEYNIHPAS